MKNVDANRRHIDDLIYWKMWSCILKTKHDHYNLSLNNLNVDELTSQKRNVQKKTRRIKTKDSHNVEKYITVKLEIHHQISLEYFDDYATIKTITSINLFWVTSQSRKLFFAIASM